jgi:N-acetylmuramoyl-L-alanine amidase
MPAILVELAYVTNVSDAQKLRDNQSGFADGIYLGILRYFGFT